VGHSGILAGSGFAYLLLNRVNRAGANRFFLPGGLFIPKTFGTSAWASIFGHITLLYFYLIGRPIRRPHPTPHRQIIQNIFSTVVICAHQITVRFDYSRPFYFECVAAVFLVVLLARESFLFFSFPPLKGTLPHHRRWKKPLSRDDQKLPENTSATYGDPSDTSRGWGGSEPQILFYSHRHSPRPVHYTYPQWRAQNDVGRSKYCKSEIDS